MSFLNALLIICPKVAQFIKIRMPLWDKPVNPKTKIKNIFATLGQIRMPV